MKIQLSTESFASAAVDVLAVGVRLKHVTDDANVRAIDKAMGGVLVPQLKDQEFKGGEGKTFSMLARGRVKAKRILIVGLGDKPVGPRLHRLLGVIASRHAQSKASLALLAPDMEESRLRCVSEGLISGAYKYTRYLTGDRKPKRELKKLLLLGKGKIGAAAREAVAQGQAVGETINLARDWVNTPPNDMTATHLANAATEESKKVGILCKVLDKKAIEKLGMPLLMAVNRGSKEEPRFIHMTYTPKLERGAPKPRKIIFVGKGLTFDSGGLCIKPADGMLTMKMDMAGAATTIATVLAAAKLALPIEVHGIVASTDNMTGSDAYKPGDVYPSRDGKTVEIINTDAEGRLVLADALAYARDLEPDYLIDHATLTGACMVALGGFTAGLFSSDEGLRDRYRSAAELSGESFWPMPLDESLRDQLKSQIADLKHTGSRYGGAITAALFLREFVGKCAWAHLDIAGPAWLDKDHGLHPQGGSGFGVTTAVEFLRTLSAS
jgi:leucyl aminopeptidase